MILILKCTEIEPGFIRRAHDHFNEAVFIQGHIKNATKYFTFVVLADPEYSHFSIDYHSV